MKTLRVLFLMPVIFIAACVGDDKGPSAKELINVGDTVPEFAIAENRVVANGAAFESPDVFIGKKSLLVFFVTWCGDCDRELPFVQYAWEQLPDLQVIAINWAQDYDAVNTYWTENEFDMPVYLDPDGYIFNLFASKTIPRIYLIDDEGKVVWKCIENLGYGKFEDNGDQFVTLIKEQLEL